MSRPETEDGDGDEAGRSCSDPEDPVKTVDPAIIKKLDWAVETLHDPIGNEEVAAVPGWILKGLTFFYEDNNNMGNAQNKRSFLTTLFVQLHIYLMI